VPDLDDAMLSLLEYEPAGTAGPHGTHGPHGKDPALHDELIGERR
jgi:hypothetical protein